MRARGDVRVERGVLILFGAAALAMAALLPLAPALAAQHEVVIRADSVEPAVLHTVTGRRVEFTTRVQAPVHVEFGDAPTEHHVYQMPAAGPIWAIFHRPGTHPYTVHVYGGKTTTALPGLVEVAEDAGHPWGIGTCGAVVMGFCLEP